ncbi:D-glycero-beta-D-manno-heptose-7-phosphate kinase [bacterium]|nr:D-glycero-beta-D-manno-heptose-7-phosphate kinase [bacterium]
MKTNLSNLIKQFPKKKVLVVGDVMVDEFVFGNVERISPEAPVPIVDVERELFHLGGAANVVSNICSLEGRAFISGIIGADPIGGKLMSELSRLKVPLEGLVIDPDRPTILKTRIIAHSQQIVRVDRERRMKVQGEVLGSLLSYIYKTIDEIDVLIISDYGKGVVASRLLKEIVPFAKKRKKPIVVDPKIENFLSYKDVTIITPNHHEAGALIGAKITDKKSLHWVGNKILAKVGCEAVLITRGEKGMSLFRKDSDPIHIPTEAKEVYDVTGAGDTVIAVLALCLAAGADLEEAARVANFAAGIVVGEVGTATVKPDELREALIKGI